MCRAATSAEISILWDAVVDNDYVENASDGRRRWAFLLDFSLQGGSDLFVGFAGAIVYGEDNLGPTAVTLHTLDELNDAWMATFTDRDVAAAS